MKWMNVELSFFVVLLIALKAWQHSMLKLAKT